MRKGMLVVAAIVVVILCYPVAKWISSTSFQEGAFHIAGKDHALEMAELLKAPPKTKSSDRPEVVTEYTHGPHQLRNFYLPEVEIDGISLLQALHKLKAAYDETCAAAGEVPLPLGFNVPLGYDAPLHLAPARRSLHSSIHLLAAISKLKVRRAGKQFRFTVPMEKITEERTLSIAAESDIEARLGEFAANDLTNSGDLNSSIAAAGVHLDPSTRVALGSDGGLSITTSSVADQAAVTSLVEGIDPVEYARVESTSVVIPAGVQLDIPDRAVFDDVQYQEMLRTLERAGGQLTSQPSTVTRVGEYAEVLMDREIEIPKSNNSLEKITYKVSKTTRTTVNRIGLETETEVISSTFVPDRLELQDELQIIDYKYNPVSSSSSSSAYSYGGNSNSSSMATQNNEDGSKTLTFIRTTLVDATGQPVP